MDPIDNYKRNLWHWLEEHREVLKIDNLPYRLKNPDFDLHTPLSFPQVISSHPIFVSPLRSTPQEILTPETPTSDVRPRPRAIRKMDNFRDAIPAFEGRRDGKEDPTEFIENLNFVIEERGYTDAERIRTAKKVLFRLNLKGKAADWHASLPQATRANWTQIEKEFLEEFKLPTTTNEDTRYFNLVYSLRQNDKSITKYLEEAEELHLNCPANLKPYLAYLFIAGLRDEAKIDMAQLYLGGKQDFTFPQAKEAVVKAYTRIGRASPFDSEKERKSKLNEVSQVEVNAEMLTFFKNLNAGIQQRSQDPLIKPTSYNPGNSQQPSSRYRAPQDVTCHNCMEKGHFSTNCPQPAVSYNQRTANRNKVMQQEAEAMGTQAPAAVAVPAPAATPLEAMSHNISRVMGHAAPAILRRPTIPAIAASAVSVEGPAAAASKPTGKPQAKKDQATLNSRVAKENVRPKDKGKAVERVVEQLFPRRSTRGRVEEDELPAGPSRVQEPPEIVISPPNEEIVMGEEEADDPQSPPPVTKVVTPPSPSRSQPNVQRRLVNSDEHNYDGPKETIPVNMAKGKDRFHIDQFLEFPVTMSLWQLLDRSPQVRAQLARAMASSRPSKRGKKAPITMASQISYVGATAPAILTEAHDEEEVVCLYIDAWIKDHHVPRTLVDTGAVVELINPKLVEILNLEVHQMDEEWKLQMADDGLVSINEYVWVAVNVKGIVALIKAYILGQGDIYDILLSKRWMHRVLAVEDHGKQTLHITGKDGVKRTISGKAAESTRAEIVGGPSVDEWETAIAEDELARLAEELDGFDYEQDQGKVRRQ